MRKICNKICEEISKTKDENKKEILEKEKKEIIEEIDKKSFSYELIVRELYHIRRNDEIEINKPEKLFFDFMPQVIIN